MRQRLPASEQRGAGALGSGGEYAPRVFPPEGQGSWGIYTPTVLSLGGG